MTPQKWYNSLRVQIVLLMTLALLPLGAVAIYQTTRVEDQASRNAELALLALTGRAARSEELVLERAFGAARLFAAVAEDLIDDPERCSTNLRNFLTKNPTYSFIGVLPLSGLMTCSSADIDFDFSDWREFKDVVENGGRAIAVNRESPISGESVFVVSEPFEIDGVFSGFLSISIPHRKMPETTEQLTDLGLQELVTFNEQGEILTARDDLSEAEHELPRDRALQNLSVDTATAFAAVNQNGERRIYTVVPISGSPATVLGIWRVDNEFAGRLSEYVKPALFPILMWCASLAVAMLSIYTLVLRHISRLRRDMDAFSNDRSIETKPLSIAVPNEFQALTGNFNRLTDDILREEARLEDTLREKNVLIKEVHHRVKNNLQLISSIMNMQIRTSQQAETKQVLARLQDRVLSLATIHRDLYQSQNGGMVNTGKLVAEIIDKTMDMGMAREGDIELVSDIDPVMLYPDQAVPLSLLVAEGMTNALKHLGEPGKTKPFVHASLKQNGAECVLELRNSIGAEYSDIESTGLGAQLIKAFSIQLGGQIIVETTDDAYAMSLRFAIEEFVPLGRDF